MSKSAARARRISTNQAVEQLLGKKAAKRLRKLALAAADEHSGTKQRNKKS